MKTTEKDIMHENGKFWVLKTNTGYCVMENSITHATSDGIEYPLTDDGLSIAVKYCDYRANRAEYHTEFNRRIGKVE